MKKTKYFSHATACIDKGANIGENTSIWHFSHIFSGATIGKNCKLGQNVVVHSTAKIGDNAKIQNNVSIYDGVELEDNVFCGPSCVFTNIFNPRCEVNRNDPKFYRKTLVKKGASIGANATIVCGATIGQYAFIGAGSVITKDVGDFELFYGVPAKKMGYICKCGEKLTITKNTATCKECKRNYKKTKNILTCLEK